MGDIEHPPEQAEGKAARETVLLRTVAHIAEVPAADWNACARGAEPIASDPARLSNPFISHEFLRALEDSGSATRETGWLPQHLLLEDQSGAADRLHALLSEVAQPRRICLRPWLGRRLSARRRPLLSEAASLGALHAGHRASACSSAPAATRASARPCCSRPPCKSPTGSASRSLHVTFPTRDEWQLAGEMGLLQRTDQQFHWQNEGYRSFDDFPREPRLAQAQGDPQGAPRGARGRHRDRMGDGQRSHRGASGTPSSPSTWTPARANGARPISRAQCFSLLGETMADQMLLVLAKRGGPLCRRRAQLHRRRHALRPLLGRRRGPSLPAFRGLLLPGDRLRHRARLARVEAGAQGAHKLARGYLPSETYSAHYIADPALRRAVADYLKRERRAVAHEIALLTEESPYRNAEGR